MAVDSVVVVVVGVEDYYCWCLAMADAAGQHLMVEVVVVAEVVAVGCSPAVGGVVVVDSHAVAVVGIAVAVVGIADVVAVVVAALVGSAVVADRVVVVVGAVGGCRYCHRSCRRACSDVEEATKEIECIIVNF